MINKLINKVSFFSNPKYQIIPIAFFTISFAYFINDLINSFKSLENFPVAIKKNEKIIKNSSINVSFNIQNFSEFDIQNDLFNLAGTIWFKFDPKNFNEADIENFSFESGEIKEKIKIIDEKFDNEQILGYSIKVSLTYKFEYHLFPIDDHKIYIIFKNDKLNNNKISFVSDDLTIDKNIEIHDWKLYKIFHYDGKLEKQIPFNNQKFEQPVIIYEIDIMRSGFRDLLVILIPLFAMLFMGFIMFSYVQPKNFDSNIMAINYAMIASFITYRFTVDTIMPKRSYMTLADYIFLFAFIFSIFIFYFSCFTSQKLEKYRGFILMSSYILTLVWLYYMLFYWK